MKELFYGIISAILIGILMVLASQEKALELPRHNNAIVIEKQRDYILGCTMYLKYSNDSIVLESVYQIFHDKYNVGDTIKN